MMLRKKTAPRLEEAEKLFPSLKGNLPELTCCMENYVACSPTDTSNELKDRVHQLETQVIWNESKATQLFPAMQISVH